jgi:ferric-dicitrate binding protein FerR (iron transport regulator)
LERKQKISKELMDKFLQHRANEQERAEVIAFIRSSAPDDAITEEIFSKGWEQMDAEEEQRSHPLQYNKIRESLAIPQGRGRQFATFYRIAASLLLLAVCIYTFVLHWQSILNIVDPVHYITQRASAGQRLEFNLPDGSHIVLNAGSKLTYPDRFRNGTREMTLQGEAFFKVVRDEERPFLVHTGKLRTQVLGTSFNIHAYPEENTIRVSVLTGKVSVSVFQDTASITPQQQHLLTVNQQVQYDRHTNSFSKEELLSVEHTIEWTEGKLVLRKASFQEVASTLERWYNIHVEAKQSEVGDCTFTSSFQEGTTLQDVLKMLSITNRITYKIEGNTVKLYAEKCSH